MSKKTYVLAITLGKKKRKTVKRLAKANKMSVKEYLRLLIEIGLETEQLFETFDAVEVEASDKADGDDFVDLLPAEAGVEEGSEAPECEEGKAEVAAVASPEEPALAEAEKVEAKVEEKAEEEPEEKLEETAAPAEPAPKAVKRTAKKRSRRAKKAKAEPAEATSEAVPTEEPEATPEKA